MQIYLIRHGQSIWQTNLSKSLDSDITSLGKVQAYYLNKKIREIMNNNFNFFYYIALLIISYIISCLIILLINKRGNRK